MAKRKIVFVIVEGPSDEEALGVLLSRIYGAESVYVHIMHKDITSEYGIVPSNIIGKIGTEIKGYASSNHYVKSDFREIIHIVDMDGAYIPNDNVIEDLSITDTYYSLTEIRTNNKLGIENRNQRKSANVNKLCNCKEIWTLPYRVFYMSCNLDHVLYNKLNSSDFEKEHDSYEFAVRYKNDIQGFMNYLSKSEFSVTNGYKDSWEYIKQELHSLERHTNLAICFQETSE